jgi:hypothetical protein
MNPLLQPKPASEPCCEPEVPAAHSTPPRPDADNAKGIAPAVCRKSPKPHLSFLETVYHWVLSRS